MTARPHARTGDAAQAADTAADAMRPGRPSAHAWPLDAWAGATAGGVLALADFGSTWLWMPWWSDRAWLLLRLLALLIPVGVLCAVSYRALRSGLARQMARMPRRPDWAPDGVLLWAPLLWVTHTLFSGGMMSRLAMRGWIEAGALVATSVALGLGLAMASRVLRQLEGTHWLVWIGMLGFSFALGKADQLLFPKLYDVLHACLGLLSFAVAFLAARAALRSREAQTPWLRWRGRAAMLATTCVALLALNLGTLRRHQNVQVGLLEPRAATSRSVLMAFEPVLARARPSRATAQATARAFRERRARARSTVASGLPSLADAHVVLITVDALRADHLGTYGYARGLSPEIDRFAGESVVFEHAYTAAPHSSYSLCSLMASEYLHETVELGSPLPTHTLPSVLTEAGYETAGFFTLGIFHTDGERLAPYRDQAFGLGLHDHANMHADVRTDRVLEQADRILAAGEPPSFLWVHYFDVHEPYEETRLGTSDLDRYDGEIQNVDRGFARLVRELRERFTHPIVFAITADHGEEFREHGGVYHGSSLYDEQARVPLIVHYPGVSPRRVNTPVELVDVAPTLLGLVDLPAPESMRGDDLRPLLIGRDFDPGPAFAAVSHLRMVVDWPYKLVANLRFGLYELYDLEQDPHERVNLASQQEERRDALSEQVYAWLDSLEPEESDPREHALEVGRLGDRRAVPELTLLLLDTAAESTRRSEAARILARLADPSSAPALLSAMDDEDRLVASEAAIALGRQYDARAHDALVPLMSAEDPELRTRAAVSLGRLRDAQAVPALLDALYVSHDSYEREEAVRWLGRLGDTRAVEPLIALLPEFRIRYLTVVALGMLGDSRTYDPLVNMLTWETHSNVRDNVGRALGQLGDARAIDVVVPLAITETDGKYTPEALVRLDAIHAGAIGGADAHASPGPRGFGSCVEGPLRHDWDYLNRTHCVSRGARARVRLSVPRALRGHDATLLLRARRADQAHGTEAHIRLGDTSAEWTLDGGWEAHRILIPGVTLSSASVWLEVELADPDARLDLDHALLLPTALSEGTP